MNPDPPRHPDDLQQAWQAHSEQTRMTIDVDLLRREVQRQRQDFQSQMFWRDVSEIGLAILMIPGWIVLGITASLPWTWYLSVPVFVWWVGFMLYYRWRLKLPESQPDDSLRQCVEHSLAEHEHQIWLLRNVVWWYLLPPMVTCLAFFAQVIFATDVPLVPPGGWSDILARWLVFSWLSLFVIAIYYFVYAINQHAVRSQLEPRRQELLALLTSLQEESASEVPGEYPILTSGVYQACSRRRVVFAAILGLGILAFGLVSILYVGYRLDQQDSLERRRDYPLLSPFEAVRWPNSHPEVQVNGEWFRLISVNGLSTHEILEFSRHTYGPLWQKRFEEDLVELLSRMGHPPGDSQYLATLEVESLTTMERKVLKDVPMTAEKRFAIKSAARRRPTK
ncbi:MAG: hypothetical protein KDA80_23160 [Planctomycetaceae bacterium]|nr:hypothetical protein [Planctomycetaceae bacterium]